MKQKNCYSQNGDIKIYPNSIWICVPSGYFRFNLYKHCCIPTAFFGFEYREHYETLTSTVDNTNPTKKKKKRNVNKADPNGEDKNSAFFWYQSMLLKSCIHVRPHTILYIQENKSQI